MRLWIFGIIGNMKKAIAVCALSMAVQTAFGDARPLVGFEAKSGFLIAAEQKSNSFVAIDAQQAGAPTWPRRR